MNLRLNPNNNLMRPPRSWRKRGRVANEAWTIILVLSVGRQPRCRTRTSELFAGCLHSCELRKGPKFHVSGVDMESPALPILSPIKAPKSGDSIKVAVAADERQEMLPAERGDPQIISRDRLAFLF
jgi:hypothetical protein